MEEEERARLKRIGVEAQRSAERRLLTERSGAERSRAEQKGGLKHGLLLMSVALAAALVVTRSPWFIRGR